MFKFDFLRYRLACGIFSFLIMAGFAGTYYYKVATRGYGFTYSVDFIGGTQILFRFAQPVTESHLKQILEKHNFLNPVMRNFSSHEILVRIADFASDTQQLADNMKSAIRQELPDNRVEILSIDSVGSGVGEMMRWKSARAILFGLIAMLMYIGLRFWSIAYGMGALISLFHDAVVILLCFLLLDKEISMNVIGAILLILGYSINDTIVIFTRIRDNLKTMKNASVEHVVNVSLNQTLRRTILTSFATSLVVAALVVFGGPALRDLSLALLIGIIFGTYSSIYIASSVMLLLYKDSK